MYHKSKKTLSITAALFIAITFTAQPSYAASKLSTGDDAAIGVGAAAGVGVVGLGGSLLRRGLKGQSATETPATNAPSTNTAPPQYDDQDTNDFLLGQRTGRLNARLVWARRETPEVPNEYSSAFRTGYQQGYRQAFDHRHRTSEQPSDGEVPPSYEDSEDLQGDNPPSYESAAETESPTPDEPPPSYENTAYSQASNPSTTTSSGNQDFRDGLNAGAQDATTSGATNMRDYARPSNVSDEFARGYKGGYKGAAGLNATRQAREAMAELNARHAATSAEGNAQPSEISDQLDADGDAITSDDNLMETNVDDATDGVVSYNTRIGAANETSTGGTGDDPGDIDLEDFLR